MLGRMCAKPAELETASRARDTPGRRGAWPRARPTTLPPAWRQAPRDETCRCHQRKRFSFRRPFQKFQTPRSEESWVVRSVATTTRARHPTSNMVSSDGSDVNARKRKRSQYSIHPAHQPEGIPGIALDVVTHILGTDYYLPDPADIASLREVSRGMCDAVDETGRSLQMFGAHEAAERGHLSTLKHLHRQGLMRFTAEVCAKGAGSGNLELLKWMRENSCPWDKFTCSAAAHGGQLEVLQWARANGCPWDENSCRMAAVGGHLEVLQWARANGCPWNAGTCTNAALGGHLEVLH